MKKVKILFIDDEEIVLKSSVRILKNSDYELHTAHSGEEGLGLVQENEFDIVITDLKMPGIGGMEVLKTLRATQPDVTVIIFTGYATVETAREALKMGAFDYIPKPFTPDELRDVIGNAVSARAESSDAPMLDLMAIVSHELKSPISVVHTTADTLYRGYFGKLDATQQKTVETILRHCQYLEDIIRSYIDLSKMEIDDMESFKEDIRLFEDVVEPVIEVPEHKSNMKNMAIVPDIQVKPVIHGDPNLLKIVATNLVSNAIKYGKEGTDITTGIYESDDGYVFYVYNEGVGISREDIETRLFGKFARLKQKGTEGTKGSGLGLYICRKIVEKHSGTIRVESKEGAWVKFSVLLPKK